MLEHTQYVPDILHALTLLTLLYILVLGLFFKAVVFYNVDNNTHMDCNSDRLLLFFYGFNMISSHNVT